MKNKGKLYGVGVGPGDPELMTIKALKIINKAKYIAFPGKEKEKTLCVKIAWGMMDNPEEKVYISCPVTMTKDAAILEKDYEYAKDQVIKVLDMGEDVVFLNLGDPTVYGTYMYVHQRIEAAGYQAQIISGVTSFCAAAARLDKPLGERSEMIHIIPASYPIEEAMKLEGTKVLMKSASALPEVKKALMKHEGFVGMVENCGLENERVFESAEEIDENAGYMSLIVVREQ